jgi:hypothetical protein
VFTDEDIAHLDSMHPLRFHLRERFNEATGGMMGKIWGDHGEPMPNKSDGAWERMWDDITVLASQALKGE